MEGDAGFLISDPGLPPDLTFITPVIYRGQSRSRASRHRLIVPRQSEDGDTQTPEVDAFRWGVFPSGSLDALQHDSRPGQCYFERVKYILLEISNTTLAR